MHQSERSENFAPVKNAPGNPKDSPDTARQLYSNLCKKWLQAAGAKLVTSAESNNENLCELSPLVSYDGEGLEKYKNQTINLPCYLE